MTRLWDFDNEKQAHLHFDEPGCSGYQYHRDWRWSNALGIVLLVGLLVGLFAWWEASDNDTFQPPDCTEDEYLIDAGEGWECVHIAGV